MPHHAQNQLLIECQPEQFAAVRALLSGDTPNGHVALSLATLAPLPSVDGIDAQHAAQMACWGVIGGAYDIEVDKTPGGLVYRFSTAWRNVPWIARAVAVRLRSAGVKVGEVRYLGAEFGTNRYWRVSCDGKTEVEEYGEVAVGWRASGPYIASPAFLREQGFYPDI